MAVLVKFEVCPGLNGLKTLVGFGVDLRRKWETTDRGLT